MSDESDTPRSDEMKTACCDNMGLLVGYEFAQQLERELSAAQKDAERYRWLRENLGLKVSHWFCTDGMDKLDAAIDAAIAAEQQPPHA